MIGFELNERRLNFLSVLVRFPSFLHARGFVILFSNCSGASRFAVFTFILLDNEVLENHPCWFQRIITGSMLVPSDNVLPFSVGTFVSNYFLCSVFLIRARLTC